MAKKKEKTEKVIIKTSADTQILKLTCELKAQAKDIYKLNQRIDKIIEAQEKKPEVDVQLVMDVLRKVDVLEQRFDKLIVAIDKCKRVKGI